MRNKRYFIPAMVLACVLAITPEVSVFADETAIEEAGEESAVDHVVSLISMLEGDGLTQENVQTAKEAYDALTMAEKLEVENYDLLEAAMEEFPESADTNGEVNQNKEDNKKQKNGTSYSFRISSYQSQITLKLRYVVDTDGDGTMDAPDVSVTSPANVIYDVSEDENALSMDDCAMELIRTSEYMQINVSYAAEGIWTVGTSERVIFELSEYQGESQNAEFEPLSAEGSADADSSEGSTKEKKGTSPAVLLIFLVAVIGIFVAIKKLPTKNGSNGKGNKQGKADEENKVRPMTDEEEIAMIRAEFERSKELYKDKDEEKEESPKQEEPLAETIIDPGDDDIEELEAGFFKGNRF